MINKKDVVRINQEIGEEGKFQNESSLNFALHIIKEKKSWLYELGYLIRSLLIDHVFIDGNKRTALALMLLYLEDRDLEHDKQEVVTIVHKIAKNNVKDINKIMRLIKHGYNSKNKEDNR